MAFEKVTWSLIVEENFNKTTIYVEINIETGSRKNYYLGKVMGNELDLVFVVLII
jgi:hypothetical protein